MLVESTMSVIRTVVRKRPASRRRGGCPPTLVSPSRRTMQEAAWVRAGDHCQAVQRALMPRWVRSHARGAEKRPGAKFPLVRVTFCETLIAAVPPVRFVVTVHNIPGAPARVEDP